LKRLIKKKICFAASVPTSINVFWRNQIILCKSLFDITIASISKNKSHLTDLNVRYKKIKIERNPNIFLDLLLLINFYKYLKNQNFYILHTQTPKAGFIFQFAAWIIKVPVRVHTFTGQVWANKKGLSRFFFKLFDKFIFYFSTHIIIDSNSQKKFLTSENIINKKKGIVFGNGSISGVNVKKFNTKLDRIYLRKKYGIPKNDTVILYIGRLNPDKGIIDLVETFNLLKKDHKNLSLVFVGFEDGIKVSNIKSNIDNNFKKDFYYFKYSLYPNHFMRLSDILCVPSYREGFGQVVVEAGACGIPSIVSNIYGLKDTIIDKKTGLFFQLKNISDLKKKLEKLITNKSLRLKMGFNSKKRVNKYFLSKIIEKDQKNFYKKLIKDNL
jgi:glycosyltransferase involved in cell wall biosynthesis